MCSRNRMISLFLLVLGCLGYQNILAGTVYQWIDETGNVNFSDVPPADSPVTETHEFIIKLAAVNNIDFEQYSIINQAELMAEWRRQLADERLAKKQLYLEEKRLQHERELSEREEDYAAGYYGGGGYYYYPYQYPNRRHRGVNRDHGANILPYTANHGQAINVSSQRRITKNKCC